MESKKGIKREFEVELIARDAPINLRVVAELISKKIARGEIEV